MSKYQIRYSNSTEAGPGFGELLGDISAPGYEYYNATLDEKINTAGTLTFTLLPTNPALPNLALRTTTIMLYRDGAELWRGRIIRTEIDMLNRRVIICEGVLAWLYDVMVKGYSASPGGDTPSSAVMGLLVQYIANCSNNRKIMWGTVQPTDVWVGTDGEYDTIFGLLSQLLANSGGFFRVRFGNTSSYAYLDYLNYPTAATGQAITFGENLFNLARVVDSSNVATTVHAEDSAGHSTTISDAAMQAVWGNVETYHKFDEECNSNIELAIYAKIWLLNNCLSKTTIEVSALDLNLTDEAFNAFYIGQPVRIVSPPHGVDTTMILTGLRTDISNPAVSQITLGSVQRGFTNYVAKGTGGGIGGGGNNMSHIDTITPTITQTNGNSTLTVEARKCGKVVHMEMDFTTTGTVNEGDNLYEGTLSNYLPVVYVSAPAYYGVATPSGGVVRITASGGINFRLVKGSISSGNNLHAGFTYLTKE